MSGARLPASAPRQCLSHGWSREAGPAPRPAGETCLPGPHVKAWRRGVPLRQATAVARAPRRGGGLAGGGGAQQPVGGSPEPLDAALRSDPLVRSDRSDRFVRWSPLSLGSGSDQSDPYSAFSPRDAGQASHPSRFWRDSAFCVSPRGQPRAPPVRLVSPDPT
jgi:hypothetical protein